MIINNRTHLESIGWNTDLEQQLALLPELSEQNLILGRVTFLSHDQLQLHDGHRQWNARLSGQSPTSLCVGDWVLCHSTGEHDPLHVDQVLPRQSLLSRKVPGTRIKEQLIAANVDVALIVMGIDLNFNLSRLERFLTAVKQRAIRPIVVLNKADLQPGKLAEYERQVQTVLPGLVFTLSALQGEGIDALRQYLNQQKCSAVCLGSSGVGKSTLINALLQKEAMHTGNVRSTDSRGRHTTTSRQLFMLDGGGVVLDMPGLREWQLWILDSDSPNTDQGFSDIAELARGCRFRDCQHEGEPDCAVRAAVSDGILDERRLLSFQKLQREADNFRVRLNEREAESGYARTEHKRQQKSLHKKYRQIQKQNRRGKGWFRE